MALSGFIKQLLETDSVFGSEAKKLTGINDKANTFVQLSADSYKPDAEGVEVLFNLDYKPNGVHSFSVQLPQFGPSQFEIFPIPDFLKIGTYIKWDIFNFATATNRTDPADRLSNEQTRAVLEYVNGSILLLRDVYSFPAQNRFSNSNLVFEFDVTAGDAPAVLDSIFTHVATVFTRTILGPLDYVIDGRIGSIINDPRIAFLNTTGSSQFNLDNSRIGDAIDRGSGIASKYASHYHSDKLINLVTNTRDDNNNLLYGVELNQTVLDNTAFTAVYDPTRAFDYLDEEAIPTSNLIRVDYERDGILRMVAVHGNVGARGQGFVNLQSVCTPRTSQINHGTQVAFGDITFEYGLPVSMQLEFLRSWPVGLPTTPERQLHEQLRTLRDAVRREIVPARWEVNIITPEISTVGILEVRGRRDPVDDIPLTFTRAPLSIVPAMTTDPVVGCTAPVPVSGNEFITFEDLFRVLSDDTFFDVDVKRGTDPNSIEFSTTDSPEKIIRFITPPTAADIFNDTDGNPLSVGEVGTQALNQVVVPAEIVLDLNGNVVFSRENVN